MNIKECITRRHKLGNLLPSNSAAIMWAAPMQYRNGDTMYRYRQESNFYYLTNFEFAESVCFIMKDSTGQVTTTLVIPNKDEVIELWEGKRYTIDEAQKLYGVDLAIYYSELEAYITDLLLNCEHLYIDYATTFDNTQQVFTWIKNAQLKAKRYHLHPSINDVSFLLKQLRMLKSAHEIAQMKQAAKVSAQAHAWLITQAKPGMNEKDLELLFRRYCLEHGLMEMAYTPIVAGGKNACTLHYNNNNEIIDAGNLVLVDAGAECNYYAADITRTWPINGKFSTAQKALYEIVLNAQLAGIALAIPGQSWEKIHLTIVEVLTEGLLECKLLKGTKAENLMQETYRKYYPHGFGHWLGLDTHDQGILKNKYHGQLEWQKLAPNMVFTIEPGLYISDKHTDIDPMWHNIGIRIEDNILITADGNEVITANAPKLIKDLEL